MNQENWEKAAVIKGADKILYRNIAQKARAIQKALPQGQAENIAIFLPNGADYIAAFFATIMSGMIAFPLNVVLTKHEIIALLKQAGVRTIITSSMFRPIFATMADHYIILYVEELPPNADEKTLKLINVEDNKPMVFLSTSGTTGKAKIVQLSGKNIETAVLGYIDKMNFEGIATSDFRYILAAPFSSAYGIMILFACLMKSFPIVLLAGDFTMDMFYKTVQAHKVTHYEGGELVIILMEQMAGRPIPYDISSLKYFGFGGGKVSENTIRNLLVAYPEVAFFLGYGMTEAAPLITKHRRTRLEKVASVGNTIKGVEIAIEADGVIVNTPNVKGEIIVRGPNVMLGYYDNEEETNKILKNGYLYTGDIGYLDEDGYLYICGRKKNIIITRGFNVQPEEVEECLLNSLLVKECFVYGQTDAFGNEMICADVVLMQPNVQMKEIRDYCDSHLAGYKRPQKIYICEEIKKNVTGKIKRTRQVP
ncbi:MAG: class I adenylate-forming enzyme family protein [Sporomusa sp.]